MTDEIKVGRLARDLSAASIEVRRAEDKTVRLSFPASSETPVERWFGIEVLSHEPGAIRMDRLQGGAAPLLFNHDWSDPVGMVDGASVRDGRLWVDAHLFATQRAAEVATMVEGGLRNVSIGYELHEVEEDKKRGVFVARDWSVLEVSIVTVPADASVGVGRAVNESEAKAVRVVRNREVPQPAATPAAQPERQTMTVETNAAAGANADTRAAQPRVEVIEDHGNRMTAAEAERQRVRTLRHLGEMCKLDERAVIGWIQDGVSSDKAAEEALKIVQERGEANRVYASSVGLSSRETQRYSLFRAIRAMARGHLEPKFIADAAFELECTRELQKKLGRYGESSILVPGEVLQRPVGVEAAVRTMTTTPGSKGGYLVNVENMGFIDILRNRSVAMAMGARVMSGLVGNVTIPRQTGKPSVTWQAGEAVNVTAADQTLGQLSMTPRTAICITDVSEQLLRQSSPSAESFVMADLAANIAIDGVDNAVINGTGGAQPLGIKNTTGVTTGQDASAATYGKVLAFVSTAAASNAIRGNPGWVTNAAGAAVLMQKQRFSSTDTPLWDGNIMDGSLVGFRAMSSEQLPSGNLIFGSWDEVVIGEWGVLELAMDSGGTRFNNATVGIRAMWMVDVLLRYPQAFVVSTNLSA
jgi:HK97 family phage major capsid protein/HK97 family phage prohead protease